MNTALQVQVARKDAEAVGICTFELVPTDGSVLPQFSAGSHIDVYLPNGLVRQYSLCNDSSEKDRYIIGVLRDPASRGGSKALHELVNEGDVLTISPPRNHFPLAAGARHTVLFAGGIGITPILCMAERLAHVGGSFEMHYCARSRDRAAFVDRIEESAFVEQVRFHFDDCADKTNPAMLVTTPESDTHLYVCGPTGFMDAVLGAARANGWGEAHLHYEFFSAQPVRSDIDCSFEVQLASSGRIIAVRKDQTIAKALEAAGVQIPMSCEQGVCGTCLTRVLEGEPDHRDLYLAPDEQAANDQILACCSRSKSARLVLDL